MEWGSLVLVSTHDWKDAKAIKIVPNKRGEPRTRGLGRFAPCFKCLFTILIQPLFSLLFLTRSVSHLRFVFSISSLDWFFRLTFWEYEIEYRTKNKNTSQQSHEMGCFHSFSFPFNIKYFTRYQILKQLRFSLLPPKKVYLNGQQAKCFRINFIYYCTWTILCIIKSFLWNNSWNEILFDNTIICGKNWQFRWRWWFIIFFSIETFP